MIDKYTEQRIKDAASIVDVVRDYVELRKRGSEWEGLCPFHDDRRLGSFKVSEAKNIATCFSCGKVLDPVGFIMEKEGIGYPTALAWLGKKYGIYVEGSDSIEVRPSRPRLVMPKLPEKEMLTIDKSLVRESIDKMGQSQLYRWLESLPWSDKQRRRLKDTTWLYALGASRGRTVFWQIDEHGNVRSGKLMSYDNTGHRIKTETPGWIHKDPLLHIDLEAKEYRACLFGEHLLRRYPAASVHIVESEKTAIICAIAYGNLDKTLWMACGGLQHLKPTMLEPLMREGRRIYLWPDKDGEAKWRKFSDKIDYGQMAIYTKYLEQDWMPEDGEKADIADIIVRKIMSPKQTMAERYPELGKVIDELNLVEQ